MPPFVLFGPPHLAVLVVVAGASIGAIHLVRRQPGAALPLRLILAGSILALTIWSLFWERRSGTPWTELAPLHLCDLAIFVAIFALLTRQPLASEVLYFWGTAGTLLAMVTPDLHLGFPHPRFFSYFGLHGAVVLAAILTAFGLDRPPRRGAVLRVLLITNLYAALVGVINLLFGTNFLYLCAKPQSSTPLDWFGPWPVYLLVAEWVAWALFSAWALPFRRRSANPAARERTRAP